MNNNPQPVIEVRNLDLSYDDYAVLSNLNFKINKGEIFVVMGGAHPSSVPHDVLRYENVDFVVIGEGEETAVELMKELAGARDLSSVKGIGFRDKNNRNKIVFTENRPLMPSLDNVPIFDDSPFPMEKVIEFRGSF